MKQLSKTTVILLAALAVVAVISGIVIFNAMSDVPSDADILTEAGVDTNVDEVLFMSLASQISSISFKDDFLRDPRFLTLVDIRVVVVPEPAGRKDPFANLSGIVPSQ